MLLRQKIISKLGFILIVSLILTSCATQRPVGTAEIIEGSYSLVSVNGKAIPAEVFHGNSPLKVLEGDFRFNSNGTCITKTIFIPPSKEKQITRVVKARYSKVGSTVTMQWEGAGKTVGEIKDEIFTMDNHGMILIYRKN